MSTPDFITATKINDNITEVNINADYKLAPATSALAVSELDCSDSLQNQIVKLNKKVNKYKNKVDKLSKKLLDSLYSYKVGDIVLDKNYLRRGVVVGLLPIKNKGRVRIDQLKYKVALEYSDAWDDYYYCRKSPQDISRDESSYCSYTDSRLMICPDEKELRRMLTARSVKYCKLVENKLDKE